MFEGLYTISFNPNRSLEPNHILFYYPADCMVLGAGVASYVKLQRQTRYR